METDNIQAIIPVNNPSPVAFLNVFEEGDKWVKTKGCDECPTEWHRKCCGNCPMSSDNGCAWHLEKRKDGGTKPYHCIVNPLPHVCKKNCVLEFKCIKGKNKGKIRRVRDIRNVII